MTEREKLISLMNQLEIGIPVFIDEKTNKEMEMPEKLVKIFDDIIIQAFIPNMADWLIENGCILSKDLDKEVKDNE